LSIIKHLMKYSSILDDARPSFSLLFFLQPAVKGEFRGYIAEYGIRREQESIDMFFRILLKEKAGVPLWLWDKCPMKSSEGINICYGRWLMITEPVYSNIKQTIDSLDDSAVRSRFEKLVNAAHELENDNAALKDSVSLQKKDLIKQVFIIIPIGIIAVAIIYWLFINAIR